QSAMYVRRRLNFSARSATTSGRKIAPTAANICVHDASLCLLPVIWLVQGGIHCTEAQVPRSATPASDAPSRVVFEMPGAKMSATRGFGPLLEAVFHFSDSGTKMRMKNV